MVEENNEVAKRKKSREEERICRRKERRGRGKTRGYGGKCEEVEKMQEEA